jgi:predicted RNA-binding protein with PUA-like domain
MSKNSKKYWLMKSEPGVYSIEHLSKDKKTWWECIRNYQARNFMMNEMTIGDEVLFYHSNAEPSGISGLAKVSTAAEADKTQFDKKSEYYDPKATVENPRWKCVQLTFEKKFQQIIALQEIKKNPKLAEMMVIKKGQRLSIQPVTEKEFLEILKMASLK